MKPTHKEDLKLEKKVSLALIALRHCQNAIFSSFQLGSLVGMLLGHHACKANIVVWMWWHWGWISSSQGRWCWWSFLFVMFVKVILRDIIKNSTNDNVASICTSPKSTESKLKNKWFVPSIFPSLVIIEGATTKELLNFLS